MNAINIDTTNITIGSECVQVYMSTAVLLCGCMYCLGTYILAIQVIILSNCILGQVIVQHRVFESGIGIFIASKVPWINSRHLYLVFHEVFVSVCTSVL